jgi:hypothetical protein
LPCAVAMVWHEPDPRVTGAAKAGTTTTTRLPCVRVARRPAPVFVCAVLAISPARLATAAVSASSSGVSRVRSPPAHEPPYMAPPCAHAPERTVSRTQAQARREGGRQAAHAAHARRCALACLHRGRR